MFIKTLYLDGFRNHQDFAVDFDGKSCVIVGVNGSGKTNILEAIHLLSTTKSLRAVYDVEMVSHDGNIARIEADIVSDDVPYALELLVIRSEKSPRTSSKRAKVNKVKRSMRKFSGVFNSVLFSPSNIELFSGSPSNRRKYIDTIFFQMDPEYKTAYRDYLKSIRQRNKVLESIADFGKGMDQLEFWDEKILKNGSTIQSKRKGFFEFVNGRISEYENRLNGGEVTYHADYDASIIDAEKLGRYRDREIAAKRTLIGPHRDDFTVNFDEFDIAAFGSRGQKRTTLLAMKLCEIDFIAEKTGRRPVLLLDDIFSELDQHHQEAVLNIIDLQQTLVTSAEDSPHFDRFEKIIRL